MRKKRRDIDSAKKRQNPKSKKIRSSKSKPTKFRQSVKSRKLRKEYEGMVTPEDVIGMRLNKYVAHCGICSRRKADEFIAAGEVQVNGKVVLEMGYKIQEGDEVRFQGKPIVPTKKYVYILMNKPKNIITTSQDEKGRKTVLDLVRTQTTERVFPVGRLDRNTTGLLLLTNDGQFAQRLSHPSYEIKKVYKATLDKNISEEDLEKIRQTLQLEDGPAPVDAVEYAEGKQNEVGIELHIGRNRIVRRIFQHLGYTVIKLDRMRYASLTKKNLGRGRCRFLTAKEVVILKHLV